MGSRRLRVLLVVAVAVLLHLSAHFAPWSTSSTREPLPEDGWTFVQNDALVSRPGDGAFAPMRRALFDPGASWSGAADCVGRVRWRPVATALFVVERNAPWSGTPSSEIAGAALISLALHVLVALGASRLVQALSGDSRAALAAGLLAAASPVALSAAAWPARQAVVLATALALAGLLLALKGDERRQIVGGALVALAALAHEAAFGWVIAFPFLRSAAAGRAVRVRDSWRFAVVPAIAFVARCIVLGGFGSGAGGRGAAGLLDGAAGIAAALLHFAVPARLHFADGPFAFGVVGRAVGIAVLVLLVVWLARRALLPAAAAALAAVAALAPLMFVGWMGAAPYQDSYLYLALPLVAAAAGLAFAELATGPRALRIAAVAAAATLLGASVAATSTRAPAFRTKSGLVELAKAETSRSFVVRTWDLASRAGRPSAAVTEEIRQFAEDAVAARSTLAGDAVAVATVSRFLLDFAAQARASSAPVVDPMYSVADAAAQAACELRPDNLHGWIGLASLRLKTGQLRGARTATEHAIALSPDDRQALTTVSEVAIAIGVGHFAAEQMEHAREVVRPDAKSPERDFTILYAKAFAADGPNRVLPWSESELGMRFSYDVAVEELEKVFAADQNDIEVRRLLYDIYLRYGDLLASLDRTAMAVITYDRAVFLTNDSEKSEAYEHRKWLVDRLARAREAAEKRIVEAQKAPGQPDIGNALVALYVAFCRENDVQKADDLFAKLETDLGPAAMPTLRYFRAVHRFASRELPDDQARAEQELRAVLRNEPKIAKAHYELARVLEWQGTATRIREARDEYQKAAALEFEHPVLGGMPEPWSLEAAERADAITEHLGKSGR